MTRIPISDLKDQARRLRGALATSGTAVTHSAALELVAKQNGYRDWNTAAATAPNAGPAPFTVGAPVSGEYLGQHFTGTIRGVSRMGAFFRVTTEFDEALDVVKFESFSAMRKRVSATVNASGVSPEKTSDGVPQMRLFTQ